jgi:flavin-dependent dehydrogenase
VLRTAPPSADHLRDLLLALVRDDRAIARRLGAARLDGKVVGWPLTTFDHRLPIVGERMVLVGDAAGLINPLNGEGIQYALLSGRWAAHVVAQALRRGDCSSASLSPYARTVALSLRYDMALAQMVVELIRNRSLNAVWLRSLKVLAARARGDPDYARTAGGVLAGLLPASDLVSRRILLGSLEQTASMLDAASLIGGAHRLVRDTIRNPGDMLAWAAGLAPAAAEVLVCAAGRTLADGAPDPASPAIRPAEDEPRRRRVSAG